MKILIINIIAVALLTSCGTENKKADANIKKWQLPEQLHVPKQEYASPVFVRTTNIKDRILNSKVSLNQQNIALIDAINLVMPQLSVVAADSVVVLNKKISVRFNNQGFGDYLKHLSNASKYHITINGNIVKVASSLSKSWDLSTLALSAQSSDASSSQEVTQKDDAPKLVNQSSAWQSMITELPKLLGDDATISSNERIGFIQVTASPDKIKLADRWIREVSAGLRKQIFFTVRIIEARSNKSDGSGIDFSLLSKGKQGNFGISAEAIATSASSGVIKIGTLLNTPLILGDANLEFILNFLEKQGKVRITNTPKILVANGITAKIKTGSNFDYIASVDSVTDQNGNVVTTPVIEKRDIGLGLELSAKIAKNNKLITVNVLPTLTAIKERNTVETGTGQSAQEVTLLDVALTQLSTQVLIKPGQSILIGGLSIDSLEKASKGVDNTILNSVFGSTQSGNSQTEIVILLTANLIVL